MAEMDDSARLLADLELTFGEARGNSKREVVQVVPVRSLTEGDLEAIESAKAPPMRLDKLRSPHHRIAQLIAQGQSLNEVALMTGYSAAYVSQLQHNPTFKELIEYYTTQRDQVFVDLLERMKVLGIAATEELLARVSEEPEKWSNRELMELAELCVPQDKGRSGAPSGGPGVAINVSFVSAQPLGGKVIEHE